MPVSLSESAIAHIMKTVAESSPPAQAMRLEVLNGGCSGYQYKFTLATTIDEAHDTLIERAGAKLVIDNTSLPIVQGSKINYGETPAGPNFRIANPNVTTACNCGQSFSTKPE